MKRILGAIERWGKNVGVDERALKEVEKIEKGERTVRAPLYPTDAKIIAQSTDDKGKIQEEIERKFENLDENLRRIEIKVTSIPAKKNPSDRLLPTQESEYRHRNDQPWEYGYYEPSADKIDRNRLTFREALALMKAHVEIKNQGQGIEEAQRALQEHPAAQRVDRPHIDRMLQYFLPFEVIKEQRVVKISDMIRERQRQQGMDDIRYIAEKQREWKNNLDMRRAHEAEFFHEEEEELEQKKIEGGEQKERKEQKRPNEEDVERKEKPK